MPVENDNHKHPHLPFVKEPEAAVERRRRQMRGGFFHPNRERPSHSSIIQANTNEVIGVSSQTRENCGVSSNNLFVIECESWEGSSRETFEERFSATVVDERVVTREIDENQDTEETSRDFYNLLIQFHDEEAINSFLSEIEMYGNETEETGKLPPGLRRDFFDSIELIRRVSNEERKGSRLLAEDWPQEGEFYMDIDLWHPGTEVGAKNVLTDLKDVCEKFKGGVLEETKTSTLILARIQGNRALGEALLSLDFVATVDLPPFVDIANTELIEQEEENFIPPPAPTGKEPIVTIVDSGILAGHPLLQGWILAAHDFDSGEGTSVDNFGHGTNVAGIVLYGDVVDCSISRRWLPAVQVCNAKVLYHHLPSNEARFPVKYRPEALIERAIRHFHSANECRVFNLSLGNASAIYAGGRQFPWAEKLDELARELDIVIVISAGNAFPSPPNIGGTRTAEQQAVRDNMLVDPKQRICNPASASIALTVGSIARTDATSLPHSFPASPIGSPAPFSRVGPGYSIKQTQSAIKPELVDFGGSLAIQTLAGAPPRFAKDIDLGEVTTKFPVTDSRLLTAQFGTSFSAPHTSRDAALALATLNDLYQKSMSANAVRALLGVASEIPSCGSSWLLDPQAKESQQKLDLVGYGKVHLPNVLSSTNSNVCLISEDSIPEDHIQVYSIPIPPNFITTPGKKGITISLAFDPPVRSSRREYLSRTMWFEVLKRISVSEVTRLRGRWRSQSKPESIPSTSKLAMYPALTTLKWSTLQVRRITWSGAPLSIIGADPSNPIIHIVVGCQSRFKTGLDPDQRYGIAVRLWHNNAGIDLYNHIRTNIRTRVVTRARVGI